MKRILFSASSVLAMSVSTAYAQDTGHDWNGWYAGVQLGSTQHKTTYEDVDYDWFGSTIDLRSLGGSVGVTGGYNIVSDNVLLGIAADLSYLTNSEEYIYSSDVQIQNDVDLLASLRGRVGHAVGDTVVYTTAGLAYANFERSWTEFNDVDDTWPDLGDGKLGVALGFGLEQAINERLSVAGAFQTNIFGENSSTNPNDFTLRINDRIHTLSLAVNYKLGDVAGNGAATAANGTPADFSGAYVGGQLGGAFADISTTDVNFEEFGSTYDVGNSGALAGISGGYNWQMGATVLGVEAKVNAGDLSESYDFSQGSGDVVTSMDQIVSLRGRAGVAAGDTLLYVLGGVSTADVENNYEFFDGDTSDTYTGITVGAGVEQFINSNLSWTTEASYTLFDGKEDAIDDNEVYKGTADLLAVSAGVNYYIGASDRSQGSGALAASHDWSGPYAGIDLGAMANEASITDVDYDEFGGTFDTVSLGAGLGGHAGYNWQNGSFVYGVVADVAAYSNDESITSDGYRTIASSISAMGTLRGRAGIATGDSLLYATAGLGAVQSDLVHNEPDADDPDSFDLSDTRLGAVVGLGVEHALSDSISFKVETLYFTSNDDEYTQDPTQECDGPDGFDGEDCAMIGVDSNITIKAGVSFSF